MNARAHRSVHRGDAPSTRTIPQSYLAGIGASGAVLGGAVVGFVLLVGVVSFDVWPETPTHFPLGTAELDVGQPERGSAASTEVASADGLLASSSPLVAVGGSSAVPAPDLDVSGSLRGGGLPKAAYRGGSDDEDGGATEGEGGGATGAEVDESGDRAAQGDGGSDGSGTPESGGESPSRRSLEPAGGGNKSPRGHGGQRGGKGGSGGGRTGQPAGSETTSPGNSGAAPGKKKTRGKDSRGRGRYPRGR